MTTMSRRNQIVAAALVLLSVGTLAFWMTFFPHRKTVIAQPDPRIAQTVAQLASAPVVSASAASAPAASASAPAVQLMKVAPKPMWHVVKRGDTLISITKDYQQWYTFTWEELCIENYKVLGRNCHSIKVGQRLNLVVTDVSKAQTKWLLAHNRGYFENLPGNVIIDCAKTELGYCVFDHIGGDAVCRRDQIAILSRDFNIPRPVAAGWAGVSKERGLIRAGTMIDGLSFGGGYWKGPVKVMQDMAYQQGEIGGQMVGQFKACCNFFPVKRNERLAAPQPPAPSASAPTPVSAPASAPVAIPVPEVVIADPVATPAPLSAFPKANEAEWEAIAGVGAWKNNLAAGTWRYGEGMLSAILPDGYRLGVGAFGMWGEGESKRSAYSWRERGFGPQFGLKRNFLQAQTDQFGQTVLLPAGWGVKLRFLGDHTSGGNPESGYAMQQDGHKTGLYVEYLEQKSPEWMVGGSAELWHYHGGRITSTWSGDQPQDRGSASLTAWAQYRHDDDWQTRGYATLAHQNWDQLNLVRVGAELRFRETVMCGSALSLSLNQPDVYREVSRGDLRTTLFGCRLELGGTLRTAVQTANEAAVRYVGPAGQVIARESAP